MRRTETPEPIWIKFCTVVDIADVVAYTNFGDHRLRGFWVAGGQISPSPIDFHRRPYNTLALPCERVILTDETITVTARGVGQMSAMAVFFWGAGVWKGGEQMSGRRPVRNRNILTSDGRRGAR